MAASKAKNSFDQIVALAPMVLPTLGLPKAKIDLITSALQADDILIDGQPNLARLFTLKAELEAFDAAKASEKRTARLVCVHCSHCNTFEI